MSAIVQALLGVKTALQGKNSAFFQVTVLAQLFSTQAVGHTKIDMLYLHGTQMLTI